MDNEILSSILKEKYINLVSGGADDYEGIAEVKKSKKSFIARHNEGLLIAISAVAASAVLATTALAIAFTVHCRKTNKRIENLENWGRRPVADRLPYDSTITYNTPQSTNLEFARDGE